MRKKSGLFLALLLTMVFLLSGCLQKQPGDEHGESPVEQGPYAAAALQGEGNDEGKLYSATAAAIQSLPQLPEYFLAAGWLSEEEILGLSGTNPLRVKVQNSSYTSLGVTAWDIRLSPDREQFLFRNGDGIQLINGEGTGKKLLWSEQREGTTLQGGLWSPAGNNLLLYYEYEWDNEYFIYDLDTGNTETLAMDLPGYFLTSPTGWLDDQHLIFTARASRKKDGTQEYSSGYRSDLAVYNRETSETTLITNADDGEYLEGLSIGSSGILFQRYFADNAIPCGIGVMDSEGGVHWEEATGRILSGAINPQGHAAWIVDGEEEGMNQRAALFVRIGDSSRKAATLLFGDHLQGPFWSPAGQRLLLSFSTALPLPEQPDSYETKYYTLIITP
ncbi:MAG: hypothetical protein WBI83_03115 [bacterium]|jgi:hypothetical protein|nr:hypothetical protein [Bacillota bacterium]HHW54606.1 hypothetical protein [Bacillota bacterium]